MTIFRPAGRLRQLRVGHVLALLLLICAAMAFDAACAWSNVEPRTSSATTTATLAVFGDVNNSDSDTPSPVFGYVCAGIMNSGAHVALSTGDALNDIADTSATVALGRWREYMAVETPMLGDFMPVWRTAGDNDRLDVAARLQAWNQVFSNYPTRPDASRRWYAKSLMGIHVVFLNTAYADHVGSIGYVSESSAGNSAEATWLVSDLKAATSGRGCKTIVVVTHYPLMEGKTTKPYSGTQQAEATALQSLFAKYGVDMVLAGDTHVYRRTMLTVVKSGIRYQVPYIQVPPAASGARSFGSSPIPSLSSAEAGWAPDAGHRGFLKLRYNSKAHTLSLSVLKVDVSGGAVSSADGDKANANGLGGTFADIPEGSRRQ